MFGTLDTLLTSNGNDLGTIESKDPTLLKIDVFSGQNFGNKRFPGFM